MGGTESRPASAQSRSTAEPSCFGKAAGNKKLEITLATLGLDNAGKTSTVLSLAKESADDVAPTVGFDSKRITVHGHDVTLYDLGGGPKIRGIWKNYLADVHGVVYVVDATDPDRIEEAAKEFRSLCQNTFIHGKPMLILANKSDCKEALSEYELTEMMDLEEIVNVNRIPTKVQASTTKSKDHRTLKDGMKWLYMSILSDWDELSERVTQDKLDAKEKQRADRRERLERIRREKEEREATEGAPPQDETDNQDVMAAGDPWKPLDTHLKLKEAEETDRKVKKEKKKKKTPRTPRSENDSPLIVPPISVTDSATTEDNSISINGTATPRSISAHKTESDSGIVQDKSDQFPADNLLARKSIERAPSPRPAPFGDGLGGIPSRLPPLGGGLPPLSSSSPLKPIDMYTGMEPEAVTKKKKKKKKKTRIGITPSTENLNGAGLMPVEEETAANNEDMFTAS